MHTEQYKQNVNKIRPPLLSFCHKTTISMNNRPLVANCEKCDVPQNLPLWLNNANINFESDMLSGF